MAHYWLLNWLDNEGIETPEQAEALLRSRTGIDRMLMAADDERKMPPAPPSLGKNLVAGTGLDLSGVLGCSASECMLATVDNLIVKSWAYFDHVMVVGADPNEFVTMFRPSDSSDLRLAMSHIQTALYVRDSGAEDLFTFRRKTQLCVDHLDQHAEEAGLGPVSQFVEPLADELATGYKLDQKETPDGLRFFFQHPALATGTSGINRKRLKKKDLARRVARNQAGLLAAALTRSAWLAKETHSALGQSVLSSGRLVSLPLAADAAIAASDVALQLELPTLRGADPADLLRMRREDPEDFEIFRAALTKTIEERLKALPAERADEIARSVVADVLNPALALMDRKMERSATLLSKRSVATVAAGGITTSIGLLAMAPLAIPGVVLTAGALLASYNDFLKDRRDVEISDLHFLWRTDRSHAR